MYKKDITLCALNRGTCNEQYKGDKDMKQSDRLRYVKEYRSNPLRKEYERKRNMICKKKPFAAHLINLGYLVLLAIFIFYCWIFFYDSDTSYEMFKIVEGFIDTVFLFWIGLLLVISVGIINKFWKKKLSKKQNSELLKKLDNEYYKKGLFPCFEYELFEHSCCEYDDEYEMNVCSVTKRMISYSDYNYCSRPGNCRHCKTFMTAYLGANYDGEFDHEFK